MTEKYKILNGNHSFIIHTQGNNQNFFKCGLLVSTEVDAEDF